MKSILQEASTVAKAVRNAWEQAGQPDEFSVKVLERREANFLGFTKSPAVISFFYTSPKKPSEKRNMRRQTPRGRKRFDTSKKPDGRKVAEKSAPANLRRTEKRPPRQQTSAQRSGERPVVPETWTSELTGTIQSWLQDILNIMKCTDGFKLEVENKVLKVIFDKPSVETVEEEV